MSRLAKKARAVKRKRDRTGHRPIYPELSGAPASPDYWSAVPLSQRKVVTKTLRNGVVLRTYMDTVEDLKGSTRGATKRAPAVSPKGAAEKPQQAPPIATADPRPSDWVRLDEADNREEAARP